jgi:hypothetical protein
VALEHIPLVGVDGPGPLGPRGATAASPHTSPTAARPTTAARFDPAANADSATAPATTTKVRPTPPPRRTIGPRGDAAWDMGTVASGMPPKGNDQRTNSARAMAPGSASQRQRPAGTSAHAAARYRASTIPATT